MKANDKSFLVYVAKLVLLFLALDYGTTFFIGITTPGGSHYVPWLDKYFNYVNWLRQTILQSSKFCMGILGYNMELVSPYILKIKNGAGVHLVYSCLGYGVISFWIAFVLANKATLWLKVKWLLAGVAIIIFTNILRVCILIIALQKKMFKPFTLDHHTFYNIVAYSVVIILMLLFIKQIRKQQLKV
ncbi:MAG TPA: exosortase/archaeosortase family protein [Chitinophagaceae bacterium]|nr:exosortase/archaeosortase family protein [Chitinophagaceae bacterium]MCC6633953.1 exosortase/archaeosortase family protein [Chitinophagaceae bacterium]HMZ45388.1 exosortase/archaeosortase family protein [Chitinophagaceae bacterium]HNE92533.1 exosortase/archaeosortase family protein [Chitinophagaceae bacterium]HNF29990.1 exosortase/archaeosortase family protein [Chitinophagaceae bacterium]